MPERTRTAPISSECPLVCDACQWAKLTVYAPTVRANSTLVTSLRKEIRQLPAGKTILRHGENISLVYSLESGWAYQLRMLPDTRRQILSFYIPGDFIPLESLLWGMSVAPYSVRALTPVRLCAFDRAQFVATLSQSAAQAAKFAEAGSAYMENVFRKTADLGRRTARGRLAQMIVEIRDRSVEKGIGTNDVLPFPFAQEIIADALGLTQVYVNRTLADLRGCEIIDFDRDKLKILNPLALQKIADEE